MVPIRSLTSRLIVVACASLPATALAQTSSIEVANEEVYLDTATGILSGRMRKGFEDKDINKIAIVAPETANVTISYWEKSDERGCADGFVDGQPPKGAEKRSAAPTGAVVTRNEVRMQKFVAKVGPLTTGSDYCLGYSIRSVKALSDDDRKLIDERLNGTVARFTMALAGSPGAAEPAFQRRLAGSPSAEDQATACSQILARRSATISAKDFASLFSCELGWPLNQLVVVDPITTKWVPIRHAVETYVSGDSRLREALQGVLLDRRNAYEAYDRIVATLGNELSPGKALEQNIIYDPLLDIDPGKLLPAITDDALNRRFQDPSFSIDRAAFIDQVWAAKADLGDLKKRKPLENKLEVRLKSFLSTSTPVKQITVTPKELLLAAAKLRLLLGSTSPPGDALKYAPQVPSTDELENYPALDTAPGTLLRGVSRTRENLSRDFEQMLRAGEQAKTAVIQSDGYKAFRERIRTLVDSSGASGFVASASFVDRLPFWVTGDVGVASAFFGRSKQPTETGVSLYFGINFYLWEFDKSEPLKITQWSGRDWTRRVALSAGITLTDPAGVAGIDGVIGSKMLMTGAGVRLTDYVRLSAGALYYLQKDTSPLSDETTIKLAPYISASLDVDVVGTVSNWFSTAKSVAP